MKTKALPDRHIAFINEVASGVPQYQAYIKHIATKKLTEASARRTSSMLLNKSPYRKLLQQAINERQKILIEKSAEVVAKEFTERSLTNDELDAFHCAVIAGKVDIEEVVPVYDWQDIVDENGRVVKRIRKTNFLKVKRPPNVREKQISIDALYRRRGLYAPGRIAGMIASVGSDGEIDQVQRFVILASGEKVPFVS